MVTKFSGSFTVNLCPDGPAVGLAFVVRVAGRSLCTAPLFRAVSRTSTAVPVFGMSVSPVLTCVTAVSAELCWWVTVQGSRLREMVSPNTGKTREMGPFLSLFLWFL